MSEQPMKLVRLSVNINEETAAALRREAAIAGVSVTEMIRRCVAVTTFVNEEIRSGRVVYTMRPDGKKVRELTLL
jgi:aerobic-type carbon monoxide dehydrogenase small subunit (CoxS/CutS family)